MSYFQSSGERKTRQLAPGANLRTFWGERIMISLVDLAPGTEVALHTHPHEQAGMVLQGQIEMEIGGEQKTIKRGDVYIVTSNVPHWVKVGRRKAQVIDLFSPVREEYKY